MHMTRLINFGILKLKLIVSSFIVYHTLSKGLFFEKKANRLVEKQVDSVVNGLDDERNGS